MPLFEVEVVVQPDDVYLIFNMHYHALAYNKHIGMPNNKNVAGRTSIVLFVVVG